jgi:hypothetical protein
MYLLSRTRATGFRTVAENKRGPTNPVLQRRAPGSATIGFPVFDPWSLVHDETVDYEQESQGEQATLDQQQRPDPLEVVVKCADKRCSSARDGKREANREV